MTITGSILRLAGMTLLVVAVAACGGLDRANRGGAGAGADGDPAGAGSIEGLEADLASDAGAGDAVLPQAVDGRPDDWDPAQADLDLGALPGSGTSTTAAASSTSPASAPLPTFDAGSFADLDAALSTLDQALGAGEPGSEGNLP